MTTLVPTAENARIYECLVLLSGALSEKERGGALRAIEQIFEERGGKKLKEDPWGRHGLAFPIKKQREGEYLVYLYELAQEEAAPVDAALRLEKSVLRHLLVKIPKHYAFTSFAERRTAWEKEREREVQEKEKEREEAVKQKIIQRAAKAPPVKTPTPKATEEGGSLEEKLGELISDEDLRL